MQSRDVSDLLQEANSGGLVIQFCVGLCLIYDPSAVEAFWATER